MLLVTKAYTRKNSPLPQTLSWTLLFPAGFGGHSSETVSKKKESTEAKQMLEWDARLHMLFTEWAWLLRMLHTLARPCVCPEPTGETGPKQILEIGLGVSQSERGWHGGGRVLIVQHRGRSGLISQGSLQLSLALQDIPSLCFHVST